MSRFSVTKTHPSALSTPSLGRHSTKTLWISFIWYVDHRLHYGELKSLKQLLCSDDAECTCVLQVLSKGEIVHHGFTEASVKGSQPVIMGEVSFKLSVSPWMAPSVQVLAYCVLPSETVLAESRT